MEKDHAEAIIRSAVVQKLKKGVVIFEENDISDAIYLVLDGSIGFYKRIVNRGFMMISECNRGEYFGEVGVLTNDRRSLRAEARVDSVIGSLPGSALVDYVRRMPAPVQGLLQSVITHLDQTTRHFVGDRLRQEKMALVGSMTGTIIHDFKNPFCLISLSAQLLRQRHRDEETQKLCFNIEKQVDRMVSMVTELSEFSKGEHNITKDKIRLKELLDEFRSLNHPYFDHNGIDVTVDVPDVQILGAKPKLFRVFQNLLSNAIEAFGEKTGFVRITGKVNRIDRQVHVLIEDNAGGIPEKIRDRLFEPFISHGKRDGTGLGTAIVRSIIEAHGGSIDFRTETGRGTIFTIRLPLA
jgi:signal transduction histidine kinase